MAEPKHGDGRLKSLLSRPSLCNSVRLTAPEAEDLKAHIPRIQDEIATIERKIGILKSERDTQITELERIRAAVAPHKKLPIEILSRIFALCGPGTYCIPGDLGPKNALWTLRQVCSTWGQLVLSQNFLWNNVSVWTHPSPNDGEDKYSYKSWGTRLRMARELLPRTGLVSISLLSKFRKEHHAILDIDAAFVHFVGLYAARLQELEITCPFYGYIAVLEADPCLFQRVESLSLFVGGYHKHDPQYEADQYPLFKSRTFTDAPRLRKFSARGEGDFLNLFQSQSAPWTQLTDLTFEYHEDEESDLRNTRSVGPTWNRFLPVLSLCNNLISCKLRLRALGTASTIHVTLPYLRSLTLNLWETNPLASLTLPSLERLHLMQKHLSPLDMASLIERSGCALRVLTDEQDADDMEIVGVSAANYDHLLQSLNHLQELHTITVFDSLDIIQIARGTRLPQLESLQFASHLPEIAVLDAFAQGFNLAPKVVGSTRKLRNVVCEYEATEGVRLDELKDHVPESNIKEKLSTLLDQYGVSLQLNPPYYTRISARVQE